MIISSTIHYTYVIIRTQRDLISVVGELVQGDERSGVSPQLAAQLAELQRAITRGLVIVAEDTLLA
jgi:hypothetical protein